MKKMLLAVFTVFLSISFVACSSGAKDSGGSGGTGSENVSDSVGSDTPSLPSDSDSEDSSSGSEEQPTGDYEYEGTATLAPYTVYNGDKTPAEEPFDSMFRAIHYAGEHALSTNVMYVEDANGLVVFKRQGLSNCWLYDGTHFVGNKDADEAIIWASNRPRSYVINGRGTAYVYLGSDDFSRRHEQDVYELGSGAFSYLYTPEGEMKSGTWEKNGYAYASGYVRLSEATYYDAPDSQWNAYIFFNIRGIENCDLGIGCFAGGGGQWKIVHNCSAAAHKTGEDEHPSFYVWQDQVVTTMKKDAETGVYSGADDLFIEAIAAPDTWVLKVTNLRTDEVFGYTHTHKDMNKGGEGYFRVIAATSYCPVVGNVWDARAGGYLKNVVWENIRVARYRADGMYTDADKEEFYPGLDTMKYGFTQGADCAHLTMGTHSLDGFYKSGAPYKAGGKYLAYSSYYDGTHITD